MSVGHQSGDQAKLPIRVSKHSAKPLESADRSEWPFSKERHSDNDRCARFTFISENRHVAAVRAFLNALPNALHA
jgi:hypothetical protein